MLKSPHLAKGEPVRGGRGIGPETSQMARFLYHFPASTSVPMKTITLRNRFWRWYYETQSGWLFMHHVVDRLFPVMPYGENLLDSCRVPFFVYHPVWWKRVYWGRFYCWHVERR